MPPFSLTVSKPAQTLLAVSILLVGVLAWERSGDGPITVIEVPEKVIADNYSADVTALQFDSGGVLQYHLHTDSAAHFPHSDETLLQLPVLLSFAEDGTIWRSVADHGKVLPGGDIVDLWSNVNIRRADDGIQISTSSISINTRQGEADTSAAVRIETPVSLLDGTGMHVDVNSRIVTLLNDVRGTYGPQAPE